MGIKLLLAILVGSLWAPSLQAMEMDGEPEVKKSTLENRRLRDGYLQQGDDVRAGICATRVINETPEAPDNEDATIEDFRIARDIYGRLALIDHSHYGDATAYAEGVMEYGRNSKEDYDSIIDFYTKDGHHERAHYFLQEYSISEELKKK